MKYLFYAVIGFVVLTSIFSKGSVDLVIDNPTQHPITVSIDELNVEVPKQEVVWVEMGKGNHKVTLEDGSEHEFDFQGRAYFLNPTKTEYLLTEHFYGGLMEQLAYSQRAPDKKVEYLGVELEGRYDVIDDLITKVTWDVGARESMPESVQADSDESYVVMKKLLDPQEFITSVREKLEEEAAAEESESK